MRVRCYMRPVRLALGFSIQDVASRTGCAKGEISQMERGHLIPRDDQLGRLATVYGDPAAWYPAGVVQAVLPDTADCPGCGDELDPDASRRRKYHGDACRSRHRRLVAAQAEAVRLLNGGGGG